MAGWKLRAAGVYLGLGVGFKCGLWRCEPAQSFLTRLMQATLVAWENLEVGFEVNTHVRGWQVYDSLSLKSAKFAEKSRVSDFLRIADRNVNSCYAAGLRASQRVI